MDLKRTGLEMGGLLAELLLLWSCLLSAVDGTLSFCSQHGSLGRKNAKNRVVTEPPGLRWFSSQRHLLNVSSDVLERES